ncbi:MAG: zinc ribbon domain-containing protein [Clostridioides sp.]|jgi:hypothetical protein|nr:zinc ribbon domain-containing protein [Clostridioides sp.]
MATKKAELIEKVSYLKGMSEGLNIRSNSSEGMVLDKIIEILKDMADHISELECDKHYYDLYNEAVDKDLDDIEESIEELDDQVAYIIDKIDELSDGVLYPVKKYCCDDCYDEDDFDEDEYDEGDEDDFDELGFIEMECPNCGSLVEIDEDLLYDEDVDIMCPDCETVILSSLEDEEYDCDCDDECDCDDCDKFEE